MTVSKTKTNRVQKVNVLSCLLLLGSGEAPREPVDLSELLLEIRHLRLQLERSIQTNTALRERLEEQLLRGSKHSETININYLLASLGKTPPEHLQDTDATWKTLWQRLTLDVEMLLYLCQMKAAGHQDAKTAIVPISPPRVRRTFT